MAAGLDLSVFCDEQPLLPDVPDDKLSASSVFTPVTSPNAARLDGILGWCSSKTDNDAHLTVDLGARRPVCSIGTKSYGVGQYHVKTFRVEYSDDGSQWDSIEEDGSPKVRGISLFQVSFLVPHQNRMKVIGDPRPCSLGELLLTQRIKDWVFFGRFSREECRLVLQLRESSQNPLWPDSFECVFWILQNPHV